MKVLLFLVIACVFASQIAAAPKNSAFNFLNEIETLFTQHLPKDVLAKQRQLHQQKYPPIEKDVTFWCVKPNQNDVNQVILNDANVKSKLDFAKPINFYIHGWYGAVVNVDDSIPLKNDAIEWARFGDCNVCTIDYVRLSRYNYSISATKHTKMVADYTVKFIKFLTQHGMNVQQASIAGFSLGAHIAGFIGAAFPQQKLAAIYGLDPAGPGFTVPSDYGASQRLDPTDASYVQCVHTNQFILGTGVECGHGNFYFNGGMWQPGCSSVSCHHQRALKYFFESLNPQHKFIGERCESLARKLYLEFLGQRCSDVKDRLGIHSTTHKKGSFFAKTNAKRPFARVIKS